MDLQELCRGIGLPQTVEETVLGIREVPAEETLRALTRPQSAALARQQLAERAEPEARGLDMLAWMLRAALFTHEEYVRRGISLAIYLDTMKCFSRFAAEYKAAYGVYGFDRDFWTYRQLSLVLFRVGELEYEWPQEGGTVSLHVPSDADLSLEVCRRSLADFERFAGTFFPQRVRRPIEMESWLLSPALAELLPSDSRINRFRRCFRLTGWDRADTGFVQWIYGREGIPVRDLPETTSLQKAVKARLLRGLPVGAARGILQSFDEF